MASNNSKIVKTLEKLITQLKVDDKPKKKNTEVNAKIFKKIEKAASKEELMKYKMYELVAFCKFKGIKTTRTKKVLVQEIASAINISDTSSDDSDTSSDSCCTSSASSDSD